MPVEREDRRDQILKHAKAVFAKKGFHDASVTHIIDRAKIARGTFYLYFEGKREVFGTLLDQLVKEFEERIRPVDLAPGAPTPLDQVRVNVQRILDLVISDPDIVRILLQQASTLDRESRAALAKFDDRIRFLIERALVHGQRLGLVRVCDTRTVSTCLIGSVKAVIEELSTRPDARKDLERIADEVVQFALCGLTEPR